MKKTLVALAVIAASSAAFAQATLTGGYTFGYATTTSAAGVKSSGLGTDGASMQLTATEDLGGGMKAMARVSLGGMQRDGAGAGEDAYLQLSGGFGTVKMGTFESCNGIQGLGGAGAPTWGVDNGVSLSGCANIDNIGWTSNDMGGLKFRAGYTDRGTTGGTGLGAGTDGAASAQSSLSIGLAYAAGGLAASADYTSWMRQGDVAVASNGNAHRVRISGSYDLGVAKIGAGYSNKSNTNNTNDRESIIGVSAPFGAVTVGANFTNRNNAGAQASGYSFGASYALSKRTSLSSHYYNYGLKNAADNTGFRVLVSHGF